MFVSVRKANRQYAIIIGQVLLMESLVKPLYKILTTNQERKVSFAVI